MKKKIHLSSGVFLINKKFQKNKFYHYIKIPNVVMILPVLKDFYLFIKKESLLIKKIMSFQVAG